MTVAPLTLAPAHVTVATSDRVGMAMGTVVVVKPTTVGLTEAVWPLLTALKV